MATTETMVFIIEDDPSFRRSTQMLIESAGLSVQAFASAEEFLRSQRPNLPAYSSHSNPTIKSNAAAISPNVSRINL